MRPNRIYITGILLLFAFLSGRAQQPRIDELECRNLKIGYEKTLHMIFPTPVKYLNMGDENIIGEVIQVCPSVIRLKSTVRDFKGETNLSVVTEDSRYYTYCISFDEGAQAVYKEGGTMPETAVLLYMSGLDYIREQYKIELITKRFPRFLNACPVWRIQGEKDICFWNYMSHPSLWYLTGILSVKLTKPGSGG